MYGNADTLWKRHTRAAFKTYMRAKYTVITSGQEGKNKSSTKET